ncbi:hypothetical protein XaFJ1_GM000070 [Xanthomonas albilineans]|nr:hypothetical protein XaFJ1_GM000070 [Xanthomonas albilineans]
MVDAAVLLSVAMGGVDGSGDAATGGVAGGLGVLA